VIMGHLVGATWETLACLQDQLALLLAILQFL